MRSAAYAEKKKTNFLKGKIRVFDKVQCDGFFKSTDLPPASVLVLGTHQPILKRCDSKARRLTLCDNVIVYKY